MGVFFGTDGLRGKVNEELTYSVAYKIGNALSILKEKTDGYHRLGRPHFGQLFNARRKRDCGKLRQ